MTSKEIISTLMRMQSVTNAEMAARLGITQAALWDRLNQRKTDNMTIKKFSEMLEILGYKVVVIPKKSYISESDIEID
ncbi:helix-turn-helix domain-containing protein [Yeguia hominis]|uniref:LysR family transcriptional regulator n=1 Tax=Yeguia hominis TaxID=2763662 RepID=A0A926DAA7_9FIRM|nr:LysR family transcriptional regulator [Yeguia hominis]MBC8534556.1 LysR family transcriptional regulator [Yeguia hominis]